ncbi:MAG: UDP-N-acetylmuramoyl-L-alanine--D-glutamate ligase, partial [Lachnospiraceae bacterium]|nr:UDP-N-acetylmuramoyl-L-alanine--D-glutamate ligase [Lachnospiraceae bacterium]
MSDYMERIKEFIGGKKVLILGFGREGRSTFDLFAKAGTAAKISIADANTALTLPEGFPQTVVHTGANYQNHIFNYDIIMKSPGIVLEPQVLTETERITSQAELFLKWYGKQTIGITGTKGKSTTTTLLYHILKENGKKTILAGNIGIPAFDILDQIEEDSLIVCELSCHQLEYTKYSPHIAIFLNLYEEHLDHYGSFEKYKEAKMNIFKYQDKDDILYIGDEVEALAGGAKSSVNVCCYTEDSKEYAEHTTLLGKHNFFDISLVAKVAAGLGIDKASFIRALKTY